IPLFQDLFYYALKMKNKFVIVCLIITTNLPLNEIKSETMLDKRRIYDCILEMCTPMYVGGTSKREAIASMKMEKAKTLLNTKNDRVYCG
ncbi:hypothetical protein PNW85_14550, partial [[Ruminococcus] gnavus]|nr:hypothetical protein [Mediterraneibacter gnavus]MDB8687868.1 hypothetical protein [Mediterraneibacter gnavus]MDB8691987.1 hypothetical protein [Mediterraneibacter gnavus]